MKKLTRNQWLIIFLSLLPLAVTAYFYPQLPDRIPSHWSLGGVVSYSDKYQLWILSSLSLILAPLYILFPKLDPKRRNYRKFQGSYDGFAILMTLFLLGMICLVISESLNPGRLSISTVITVFLGVIFVYSGNILPKVRSNFFMGIKNPWTLSNEEVWVRTHRLAGKLWFVTGIALFALALLTSNELLFVLMLALILIAMLVPTVMSYLWYRQLTATVEHDVEH